MARWDAVGAECGGNDGAWDWDFSRSAKNRLLCGWMVEEFLFDDNEHQLICSLLLFVTIGRTGLNEWMNERNLPPCDGWHGSKPMISNAAFSDVVPDLGGPAPMTWSAASASALMRALLR